MSVDDQTSGERWLDMTNAAYDKVTGFQLQVAEPERQAMWIEVTGTSANQWTCSISLKPLDAAAPHDAIVRHRDLAIVVPECDFDKVRGATIAAHGGRAELVAVEQGTAYLRLGGGCQGCAMATVTLSQGIERAIIEAVAEITNVVDVIDHQSGTNPYFEAAKK